MRMIVKQVIGLGLLFGWMCVMVGAGVTQEPKPKEGQRKGTLVGVVTAKGENWIEVKADGEEKARRYVPHWRGGLPAQGGGPDKAMVAQIRATPVGSRVRLEWEHDGERARVVKLEVLKKAGEQPKDKSNEETHAGQLRSGTVAGVIQSKKEQGKNIVVEVKAPGEEKARAYFVQFDPKVQGPIPEVLQAVREAPVGSQVFLEWVATGHGPAIVRFQLLRTGNNDK
jgi:hypothetical protein